MSGRSGDGVDLVEADDNLRSAISELERIADEYDDHDAMSTLDDLRDDINDIRDELGEAESDYDDLRSAADEALRQFERDLSDVADRLDGHESVNITYGSVVDGDLNIHVEEDEDGITLTTRELGAAAIGVAGVGAIGTAYGFLTGASQRSAPAPAPEHGLVNQYLLNIAWGEMGEQRFTLLSQDAYETFTNGEGTDLAAMEVKFAPGESEYRLYHIDTGEAGDDNWQEYQTLQKLLEDYGPAMKQPSDWTHLDNDNIAEYLTDLSRAQNPEELDFDKYLGNRT